MLGSPPFSHVESRFTSGEQSFLLRQLAVADAESYREFFNSLDPETMRSRFGHLISPLNLDVARSIVSRNPEQEPALAIFNEACAQIVGIGRFRIDFTRKAAEIGLVVANPWRRLGLAKALLQALIDLAISRGLASLHAYVSTENTRVPKLLTSYQFALDDIEEGEASYSLSLPAT